MDETKASEADSDVDSDADTVVVYDPIVQSVRELLTEFMFDEDDEVPSDEVIAKVLDAAAILGWKPS